MIDPRWLAFDGRERDLFQLTVAFLEGRIAEPETLRWTLGLAAHEGVRRAAALEAVDRAVDAGLAEPWRSAWRLVEEAWREPARPRNAAHMAAVRIQERLKEGDLSGTLIEEIVDLVRPRLAVAAGRGLAGRRRRWRPRRLTDLVHASLTSGALITPAEAGLDRVGDAGFLAELARRLEDAVLSGLAAARRFGWDGRTPYGLGLPDRIALIPVCQENARDDVDEHATGLAPALKLLHAILRQVVDQHPATVAAFAARLKEGGTLVEARLWAALAVDRRLATPEEVGEALADADERRFWGVHTIPELAELRAVRFGELTPPRQAWLVRRIMRGPPRSIWPKDVEADRLAEARRYWIARELRRLQVAGHALPAAEDAWLAAQLAEFQDLATSTRLDEGFPGTYEAFDIPPPGDDGYDLISGRERLERLEQALRATRVGWGDDPADRAASWIGDSRNALLLIADLESRPAGARDYPEVWDRFGWRHHPAAEPGGGRNLDDEARRVVALLQGVGDATLEAAVDGLSDWLSDWRSQAAGHPHFASLWRRLWPYAVARTNREQPEEETPRLDVIVRGGADAEPRDLDTYNTAAGKMVGAFLALCPNLTEVDQAFPPDAPQTELRELLVAETGRAGLVVKHRLAEHLSYFMKADAAWTRASLLPPLTDEGEDALALWNAVARRALSPGVLEFLAPFMLQRAVDPRLGRETRQRLAFRLVVDCLHALRERREPWAPRPELQHMLRSLDEEVRAHAAEAPQRFLRDVAQPGGPTPEALFDDAVAPFLAEIWPQERSLSTPGVSRAFADLPATAGDRFAAAVDAVERFLVPFDCWSLIDYGLYGADEMQTPRLAMIDTPAKAEALLRLLDRTVGASPGAVVPHGLSSALQQIRAVAPKLAERPDFRRLATAARL
ncbi:MULTISPECIES: hypothetical protein [unclassified Phenylobacterium]|uniref:hypothetical protein n=1 Tax=unclassified Phenylobacterium TaxID=2640670 RepID=UPI00083A9BAD|nr:MULTISPECIES: hypothetical protein [unclassified Phenylobacterium]